MASAYARRMRRLVARSRSSSPSPARRLQQESDGTRTAAADDGARRRRVGPREGVRRRSARSSTTKTGITPSFDFGSSGLLAKQIEQGAPFYLYAAANKAFVDQVVKAGKCDAATARSTRAAAIVAVGARTAAPATLERSRRSEVQADRASRTPSTRRTARPRSRRCEKAGIYDAGQGSPRARRERPGSDDVREGRLGRRRVRRAVARDRERHARRYLADRARPARAARADSSSCAATAPRPTPRASSRSSSSATRAARSWRRYGFSTTGVATQPK